MRFDGSRTRLFACMTSFGYVTHAALAGATHSNACKLCEAGSYGSVSGEWLGIGVGVNRYFSLLLRGLNGDMCSVR